MARTPLAVTKVLEANYEKLMAMATENPDEVFPTVSRLIGPLVDAPNGIPAKKWAKMERELSRPHSPQDWQYHLTNLILASQDLGTIDKKIGPKGHLKRDYGPRNESVEQVASMISEDVNNSYRLTRTQLRIKNLVESVTGWTVVPLREVI